MFLPSAKDAMLGRRRHVPMTSKAALPPWLLAAVNDAGDATVILKPGNRPFVVRHNAPYHLGTQPLTTLIIEGLTQQLLSEHGQQALSGGDPVEETLAGSIPVTVHAIRMDYDIVIRVRRAQDSPTDVEAEPDRPAVDEITRAIEEETRGITARAAELAATESTAAEAPSIGTPEGLVKPSHGEALPNESGDPAGDIDLPVEETAMDAFIAALPAVVEESTALREQEAGERLALDEALQQARQGIDVARRELQDAAARTEDATSRLDTEIAARRKLEDAIRCARDEADALRHELTDATQRAQTEIAVIRRELEQTTGRAQETAAQLDKDANARRELEVAVGQAQEDAESARRQLADAARRAAESAADRDATEAARRAQEDCTRRELEDLAQRARKEAEAARRELAESTRRAEAATLQRDGAEAARREQEAAARRELEQTLRQAREDVDVVRRELADGSGRVQETTARLEAEAATRRALEDAARRAHEEAESARHQLADAEQRAAESAVERDTAETARRAEAAGREQEAATRRELEQALQQARQEIDVLRDGLADSNGRVQESAARLEAEAVARRELEDAARWAHEEAESARRQLAEATQRVAGHAAEREAAETSRRQEAAARQELEQLAQRALNEAETARRELAEARRRRETDLLRAEGTTPHASLTVGDHELADWIGMAADRGATTLYLAAHRRPSARIDGRIELLASEPLPLSMFQRAGAELSAGTDGWKAIGEWTWSRACPRTGTVECQAFSDERGGGLIVHLPVRVGRLEYQVPRHIRAACETREGLIVISAPFAEDVAALVNAVVSSTIQRRAVHAILFGTSGNPTGAAFISDRRIPRDEADMADALERALRERPDLLVFVPEGPLPAANLIASAAAGRLVIVGVLARSAPRALEVLLESGCSRAALAEAFKAGCSWRQVRSADHAINVVADVLTTSTHVRSLIKDGDIEGLHRTQQAREDGMRTVDDALVAAVGRRQVGLAEAAACAVDRKELLTLLRRRTRERRVAQRASRRA